MMVAAPGTFIDEMLKALGYKNAFGDKERYPAITEDALKNAPEKDSSYIKVPKVVKKN